jgi:SAM-dependent methyltransferase
VGLYRFPADLERIVAELAAEKASAPLRETAEAVARLSDLFVGKAAWESEYGRDPALRQAYLSYFLPVNVPKIAVPLAAWTAGRRGLWSGRRLRCLDLGSGPGTALLGLCDFVRRLPAAERPSALELTGVDQSGENLRDAKTLLGRLAAADPELPPIEFHAFRLDMVSDRAELFPMIAAAGRFDLVTAMNVVCEIVREGGLEPAAGLVETAAREVLDPRGAVLLVEPGLRETARDFHRLRDRLLANGLLHVHAPCVHEAPCPALATERDWCIADLAWEPPQAVASLDRLTGLRKSSLKFAYLVLAPEAPAATGPSVWRVVSDVLDLKGERRVYLCADGRWIVLAQLKRERTPAAEAFSGLRRGDLVEVTGLHRKGAVFRLGREGSLRRIET